NVLLDAGTRCRLMPPGDQARPPRRLHPRLSWASGGSKRRRRANRAASAVPRAMTAILGISKLRQMMAQQVEPTGGPRQRRRRAGSRAFISDPADFDLM